MKIYQEGETEVLRNKSKRVEGAMFGTKELKDATDNMFKLLSKEHDGVAIAAPQVGLDLQIFCVSPNIELPKGVKELVYINPKITKYFNETVYLEEGCLSVRWLYGSVKRHKKVSITAYNLEGRQFTVTASGLLAHIFQHETDHLSGVLFIDKAVNVSKLSDEDINEMKKKNERT